ncbi:lysozyme inhibitor LprI family protein [Polaromonas jejuensis]|uniref:Lysozyme inhibitor LprI family protein n=1 Tax=Polaromonas jejuensis TaxID=457502 RepID=A0ABW0Q626_9BURK|nr:lysozyme inhibitor LprI family protein [Polaromonas jejuensis]
MRQKFSSLFLVAFASFFILAQPSTVSSTTVEDESMTEAESWNNVLESPQCKEAASKACCNEASKACEALIVRHSCKYDGSSDNANRCAAGKRAATEEELNKRYGHLLRSLRKAASREPSWANAPKALVNAQRAWNTFRERECGLVAESYHGGALQPAMYEECMLDEAKRRMEAFDRHIETFSLER